MQFTPSRLVKFLAAVINVAWVLGIISFIITLLVTPIGLVGGMLGSGIFDLSARAIFHQMFGPIWLMGVYSSSLLASGFFLWIVYHLRLLMRTIKAGDPFNPANPGRIRRIAYAVVAWAPLRLVSFVLKGNLIFHGPSFTLSALMPLSLLLAAELVFFGLGILVIAQIFERGLQLQQDQDLTV